MVVSTTKIVVEAGKNWGFTKHGGALSYKVGVFCTFTGQNGLRNKKHGFDSHELRSEPTEAAHHC
jgi:peroxiredoxin family protein